MTNIALPTPWRRVDREVCIDFTSPWSGESRFSAPIPNSSSLSQINQNSTSGDRSPATSRACALPRAVSARPAVAWTFKRSMTRGSSRSPLVIRIVAASFSPPRPCAVNGTVQQVGAARARLADGLDLSCRP